MVLYPQSSTPAGRWSKGRLGFVAGLFAGSTYTTIGYNDILPRGWGMLSPLIAISGLFSFGWSGSVLVDVVARCHRIKEQSAAAAKARARRM
jgi:hypothetical protein